MPAILEEDRGMMQTHNVAMVSEGRIGRQTLVARVVVVVVCTFC